VLPGLAGGFLLVLALREPSWITWLSPALERWALATDPRSPLVMFLGAALVGILTTLLIEWVRRLGRVDQGAAMGVVFTALFALGLVMIEQSTRHHHVDLDAECVLYGMIELAPLDQITFWGVTWPRSVFVLLPITLVNLLLVGLFYKELKITSFDPDLARTMGMPVRTLDLGLMTLVAMTTVACFESIGSILVIAMLVVPPATALLLTRRLGVMILLSLLLAMAAAWVGHLAAITLPRTIGFDDTSTSGSMAAVTGFFFLLALLLAPGRGLFMRRRGQVEKPVLAVMTVSERMP